MAAQSGHPPFQGALEELERTNGTVHLAADAPLRSQRSNRDEPYLPGTRKQAAKYDDPSFHMCRFRTATPEGGAIVSWAKIDDQFWCHPKVAGLSLGACGVWVIALSWCAHQKSDGAIPRRLAKMLEWPESAIDELLAEGLWEETERGWQVHDYLEYNPSKVDQARAKVLQAQRQQVSRSRTNLVPKLAERDGFNCRYCALELTMATATIDHIQPVSLGGSNAHSNLCLACGPCNSSKGAKTAPSPEIVGRGVHVTRDRDVQSRSSHSAPIPIPIPDPRREEDLDLRPPPQTNASVCQPPQIGGVVVEMRSAIAIGYSWLADTWYSGAGAPDRAEWKAEYEKIGAFPEAQRVQVAKHMAATPYLLAKRSKATPGHLVKFWTQFVEGPRGSEPEWLGTSSKTKGPSKVADADAYERQAAAVGEPVW